MSTMYVSAGGHRGPRSRQLLRSQSDPGHPHVTPPYTIQPPVPARRTTEPTGIKPGAQYPRSPSRSSSVEHNRDPYVPHSDTLLAQHQTANSPDGTRTSPSTPLSPRSPSPQQLGHQRSSSRQGSIRAPQALNEPLIRDVPPPRTALNASSAVTAPPQTHLASSGQGQGQANSFPVPSQNTPPTTPLQSVDMQRQGSHHSVYQLPPASLYEIPTGTNISHHHSVRHQSNVPHHHTRHRSRSRPPSAASHRYASSITQPMYGHGNPASLDASRTSLNGGVPLRNHHATSLPPGTSIAHHPGTGPSHMPSESPQRSRLHPRVHSSSVSETSATTHLAHTLHGTPPDPPSPPLAANELHRSTQRPPLPENYDGQTRTRYVNMLLALDDISPIFNILASFFTWILLAGFLLFPGTFASWQDLPAGSPQSDILSVVNHVSLYVIAWICTGIGASGMLWLWWRWQNNYIWLTNRIFVPGLLNSVAGVISTLSSIYGAQAGVFGKSEESTIIVTGLLSVICGILVLVYEFWLLRILKSEHNHIMGVEMAGKHGEGVMGEKEDNGRWQA